MILNKISKLFMLCGVMFTMSASVYASGTGTVIGNDVNVRSAASTQSEVVGKVHADTKISISKVSGDFYEVAHNDETSYISKDFVKVISSKVTITADDVNIRKSASADSDVVAMLSNGETATASAIVGNFYEISFNGETAYVSTKYAKSILEGELPVKSAPKTEKTNESNSSSTYVKVNSDNGLKLRDGQSKESDVILTLPNGYCAKIIKDYGDWIKVELEDGTKGYLSGEFTTTHKGEVPKNTQKSNTSKGVEIANYGKKFIGTPYKWGGTNLNSGVDCSGFVYSVYKNFGITLNRSSYEMPANGKKISKSELVPGDLVFFDTSGANNGKICHVGIYTGGGNFVHSSSGSRRGVIVSNLSEGFYKNAYVTAARVL